MARRYVAPRKNKRPIIIIGSEGEGRNTEKCYFGNFSKNDLRIKFSTEDYIRTFLVLDTDLSEKRISEIKEIEQKCKDNNIEIITSAPTFEIWFLMHFRNNKLRFQTSKDVKRELEKVNGTYSETMDMYNKIKNQNLKNQIHL